MCCFPRLHRSFCFGSSIQTSVVKDSNFEIQIDLNRACATSTRDSIGHLSPPHTAHQPHAPRTLSLAMTTPLHAVTPFPYHTGGATAPPPSTPPPSLPVFDNTFFSEHFKRPSPIRAAMGLRRGVAQFKPQATTASGGVRVGARRGGVDDDGEAEGFERQLPRRLVFGISAMMRA